MQAERLVTMANEIAAFFHSASEDGQAAQSVALHLRRFWDPRMRQQIITHLKSGGGEGLTPISRAAIELLAAEAEIKAKSSAR